MSHWRRRRPSWQARHERVPRPSAGLAGGPRYRPGLTSGWPGRCTATAGMWTAGHSARICTRLPGGRFFRERREGQSARNPIWSSPGPQHGRPWQKMPQPQTCTQPRQWSPVPSLCLPSAASRTTLPAARVAGLSGSPRWHRRSGYASPTWARPAGFHAPPGRGDMGLHRVRSTWPGAQRVRVHPARQPAGLPCCPRGRRAGRCHRGLPDSYLPSPGAVSARADQTPGPLRPDGCPRQASRPRARPPDRSQGARGTRGEAHAGTPGQTEQAGPGRAPKGRSSPKGTGGAPKGVPVPFQSDSHRRRSRCRAGGRGCDHSSARPGARRAGCQTPGSRILPADCSGFSRGPGQHEHHQVLHRDQQRQFASGNHSDKHRRAPAGMISRSSDRTSLPPTAAARPPLWPCRRRRATGASRARRPARSRWSSPQRRQGHALLTCASTSLPPNGHRTSP